MNSIMKSVENGNIDQAVFHLEKAKRTVQKLSTDDPRTLIVRLEEARIKALKGMYKDAELITGEVILLANPREQIYRNIYSRALLNSAEYNWFDGDQESAGELFKKAIEWRKNQYGENSNDVTIAQKLYEDFLYKAKN